MKSRYQQYRKNFELDVLQYIASIKKSEIVMLQADEYLLNSVTAICL